jgi:hypothetical protein
LTHVFFVGKDTDGHFWLPGVERLNAVDGSSDDEMRSDWMKLPTADKRSMFQLNLSLACSNKVIMYIITNILSGRIA